MKREIKIFNETATPFFFASRWIGAFAALADALVAVFTLGFYWPLFHVSVMKWQLEVEIGNKKNQEATPAAEA